MESQPSDTPTPASPEVLPAAAKGRKKRPAGGAPVTQAAHADPLVEGAGSAPLPSPVGSGSSAPLRLKAPVSRTSERVDQVLASLMPEHSRSRLQQWIRDGRVRVDGRQVRPADKLWGGERLDVSPDTDPQRLAALPEAIGLSIVHEDESVIVIDKPAGLVVHPGSGNWQGTMLNALLHHHPPIEALPRAGIVHRLDKDTSGLMMVAKTLTAHTALVRALAARDVERIYQALVLGAPSAQGEIDRPIGRHPVHRVRMAVVERGRPALTRFRVLDPLAGATLLECRLSTGRTHQIRVHLEAIGHPVLGDPVYGPRPNRLPPLLALAATALGRQALHAVELAFRHPVGGTIERFHSALPADISLAIATLAPPP